MHLTQAKLTRSQIGQILVTKVDRGLDVQVSDFVCIATTQNLTLRLHVEHDFVHYYIYGRRQRICTAPVRLRVIWRRWSGTCYENPSGFLSQSVK